MPLLSQKIKALGQLHDCLKPVSIYKMVVSPTQLPPQQLPQQQPSLKAVSSSSKIINFPNTKKVKNVKKLKIKK